MNATPRTRPPDSAPGIPGTPGTPGTPDPLDVTIQLERALRVADNHARAAGQWERRARGAFDAETEHAPLRCAERAALERRLEAVWRGYALTLKTRLAELKIAILAA